MKFKMCLLAAVMSVVAVANADYKALQTVNYQSYGEVFSDGLQTVEIDGAFCVIAKFEYDRTYRSRGGIAMQCDFNDKYKANRTQPKKTGKAREKR